MVERHPFVVGRMGRLEGLEPLAHIYDRMIAIGRMPLLIDRVETSRTARTPTQLLGHLLVCPHTLPKAALNHRLDRGVFANFPTFYLVNRPVINILIHFVHRHAMMSS